MTSSNGTTQTDEARVAESEKVRQRRDAVWVFQWCSYSVIAGLSAYYPTIFVMLAVQKARGLLVEFDDGWGIMLFGVSTVLFPIFLIVLQRYLFNARKREKPWIWTLLSVAIAGAVVVALILINDVISW